MMIHLTNFFNLCLELVTRCLQGIRTRKQEMTAWWDPRRCLMRPPNPSRVLCRLRPLPVPIRHCARGRGLLTSRCTRRCRPHSGLRQSPPGTCRCNCWHSQSRSLRSYRAHSDTHSCLSDTYPQWSPEGTGRRKYSLHLHRNLHSGKDLGHGTRESVLWTAASS